MAKSIRMIGLDKAITSLKRVFDLRTLSKNVENDGGEEIIDAVISTAKSGVGPDDVPYKTRKGKNQSDWLYDDKSSQHMLDKNRFKIEFVSGKLKLSWTALKNEMAQYAAVHNGPSYQGTRSNTVVPRPWFHIEAKQSKDVTFDAVENAINKNVEKFNNGTI